MAAGDRYVILAEFTPWDPVAAAAVTVRACSVDDARVTSLNGVAWWPAIATAPKRTLDLFDGEFGGQISAGIGDIELALAAFPNAARYAWGERPVKLWRGVLGAAWAGYTLIFEGLTRPPRAGNGRIRIGLRVDDRWLDRPLLATYAGTGGAEGPADLKGQPKPLALGAPQFVEGVIINRTMNIVQLHGYGAINGVPTALSRLSRYSGSAGNDASYAALAGATIAAGAWRTCLAEGLVRFGAPPGGVASFLMQGDSGSALGWVRTPGQVIRRIALIAGATAGQIDATSLAALDTACPFNISLFLREQTTARDVIQSIAASCNAAAGVSWLGKLFVARTVLGSPALTLAADGSSLPPVAAVEMLESSAPFWRTALEAERTWRVHSAGEFESIEYDGLIGAPTSLADVNAGEGSKLAGIEGNATRNTDGGNHIRDPRGFDWTAVDGATVEHLGLAGPIFDSDRARLPPSTAGSIVYFCPQNAEGIRRHAVTPGERFHAALWAYRVAGSTSAQMKVTLYDAQLTSIATADIPGTLINNTTSPAGAWYYLRGFYDIPAGVAYVLPHVAFNGGGSTGDIFIGMPYWGKQQPGADVTSQNTAADTANVNGTPAATVLSDISAAAADATAALAYSLAAVPPKAITALGASAALDVVIPNGESRNFQAIVDFDLATGTRTLTAPMEYRIGSGSWTGFGTADSAVDTGPSRLSIQNTGTISNSSGAAQNYQVRAVVAITGGTGGTVDGNTSFIGPF